LAEEPTDLTDDELRMCRYLEKRYTQCILTESSGLLPDEGGWNDQDPWLHTYWLIFYGELQSAKGEAMQIHVTPEQLVPKDSQIEEEPKRID